MKQQDVKLLPITKVPERGEFLIDIENRELRDFNNPDYVIKMHSPLGRQIIKGMQSKEWNVWGMSTGKQDGLEV